MSYLKSVKKYGLSEIDYLCLATNQNFVCASCGEPEISRPLSVDHDHVTGKVRGLLCNRCNRVLGFIGDSSEKLRKLANYLDNSKKIC